MRWWLLILRLGIVVLRVLVWLTVLAVVGPWSIIRGGYFLGYRFDRFTGPIESNRKRVRFDDQLRYDILSLPAYLRKVAGYLLLPLIVCLVLVGPL